MCCISLLFKVRQSIYCTKFKITSWLNILLKTYLLFSIVYYIFVKYALYLVDIIFQIKISTLSYTITLTRNSSK